MPARRFSVVILAGRLGDNVIVNTSATIDHQVRIDCGACLTLPAVEAAPPVLG